PGLLPRLHLRARVRHRGARLRRLGASDLASSRRGLVVVVGLRPRGGTDRSRHGAARRPYRHRGSVVLVAIRPHERCPRRGTAARHRSRWSRAASRLRTGCPNDLAAVWWRVVDAVPATASPVVLEGAAVISASSLTKVYPTGVTAVGGVDLEVRSGEIFGLLGPNGAGKTTTVGMLTTRVIPSSGSAIVA